MNFSFRAEDHVRVVVANQRAIGRDDHDVEVIDGMELLGLGVGRASHTRQFGVHAEVILEGDRRQRLVFIGDLHFFLGFHGLMQPIAPASARHQAAGELIDDDDFAALHDIIHVFLEQRMRPQGLRDVVENLDIMRIVEVLHMQQILDVLHPFFG